VVELRTRSVAGHHARQADRTVTDEAGLVERDLQADRTEEALRRVEALTARDPGTGTVSLLRGRVLARAGRPLEALQALEEAVRQDPLLGNAYYHLGLAAARVGEFRKAHESLSTYARLPDANAVQVETAVRAATLIAELRSILEEKR